jgi:hypothetical protein
MMVLKDRAMTNGRSPHEDGTSNNATVPSTINPRLRGSCNQCSAD